MDVVSALAAGAAVALGSYMWFCEQFALKVREYEISFPNLPPAFDGYTILHLADLHLTKLGLLEKKLMCFISQREVDTCYVTGDATAQPRASDIFRRVCSVIPHKDPIYMVLGNSEHKPWLDTQMLIEALSFPGLNILINASCKLDKGGDSITLVGVDDPYSRHADIAKAFEGVDPNDFIVFLTHSPSVAPDGIQLGADLVLAGHTHGGQVRIPGVGVLWTHMRKNKRLNDGFYDSGAISKISKIDAGNSKLLVSRGVGTSRLHIRFNCPPEIIYITLRRG